MKKALRFTRALRSWALCRRVPVAVLCLAVAMGAPGAAGAISHLVPPGASKLQITGIIAGASDGDTIVLPSDAPLLLSEPGAIFVSRPVKIRSSREDRPARLVGLVDGTSGRPVFSDGNLGWVFASSGSVDLKGVELFGFSKALIAVGAMSKVEIVGNRIENCHFGVLLLPDPGAPPPESIRITGNTIERSELAVRVSGGFFLPTQILPGVKIRGNRIVFGLAASEADGRVGSFNGMLLDNVVGSIRDNRIEGFDSAVPIPTNAIRLRYFAVPAAGGLDVEGNLILGNRLGLVTTGGAPWPGFVTAMSDAEIRNNVFMGNGIANLFADSANGFRSRENLYLANCLDVGLGGEVEHGTGCAAQPFLPGGWGRETFDNVISEPAGTTILQAPGSRNQVE